MATRLLKFGTYEFPDGFRVREDPTPRLIPAAKYPRAHGSRAIPGYLDAKTVIVDGGIYKGPLDQTDVRDRLDALRAAIANGPNCLYLYSDRYYRNVQGTLRDTYEVTAFARFADVQVEFICPDPFQYSSTSEAITESVAGSGETWNVTNGGNAPSAPVLEITVGGSGSEQILFTMTNVTTSQQFTLSGEAAAADVIVVNCEDRTVQIAGIDKMALFEGLFPELAVGVNTMLEQFQSSAITQVVVKNRNRWW